MDIIWIAAVFALFCKHGDAQMFDSISAAFHAKPHLDLRVDTRNSFISNKTVKIFGLKAGLNFNDQVKTGLGYHAMLFPFTKEKSVNLYGMEDTVNARLRFGYGSVYFEYVFYSKGRWELSIPVQIGAGLTRYEYEISGRKHSEPYKPVILYEPSMTAQYQPLPWAGIGMGMGYRLLPAGNKALDENFNYPVYVLKIFILPKALFISVFRKKG